MNLHKSQQNCFGRTGFSYYYKNYIFFYGKGAYDVQMEFSTSYCMISILLFSGIVAYSESLIRCYRQCFLHVFFLIPNNHL